MGVYKKNALFSVSAVLTLFLAILVSPVPGRATPLDDYIAVPDPSYGYSLHRTVTNFFYSGYVLDMRSQTWRDNSEVDRPLWEHWVTIVVPNISDDQLRNKALLLIASADNGEPYDEDVIDYLASIALIEQAVVVLVEMVPNQPLLFAGESVPRYSDEIIAYSWAKFLETGDSEWLAQLPMTKSIVRAMDSVQNFCSSLANAVTVDEFVVCGGSKHGWVTWLSAVVDNRVTAIIPVVIDLLNMDASFKHHFHAYGFWAPAVQDYEMAGIFQQIDSPEMAELISIIDPYIYRDRVTIPRFIVNSAGDEFFLPDSSNYYFNNLPPEGLRTGGKYLRYIPNAGHSLDSIISVETLSMYFHATLSDEQLPQFSWEYPEKGMIRVQMGADMPSQILLWQATNSSARDFRYSSIGDSWTSTVLQEQGDGLYVGIVEEPPQGWTAFFIEVSYPSSGLFDYKFTTDIHIVPEFLPYEADIDYDGEIEGDVNDDGFVDLKDAVAVLQILSGSSADGVSKADYDGDRKIGIPDCLYIFHYILNH